MWDVLVQIRRKIGKMSRLVNKCGLLLSAPCCRLGPLTSIRFLGSASVVKSRLKYRPRRALLYVPGDNVNKIMKVPLLDVDCAVLDCEDGVAASKKAEARDVISTMLDTVNFGRTERGVRINSIDSGMAAEDIAAVFGAKRLPESLVVPKVESIEHIDWLADRFNEVVRPVINRCTSIPRLIIMMESARALLDLDKICRHAEAKLTSTPFVLDAMIFGSDDFCASIGVSRTKSAMEILYARQHFVTVAKAYRLQAIDMVYIDYKDTDGFREQCVVGAQMGFTGKQVIHPGQIPVAQTAFLPSPQKIEWATKVIEAFEEHQKFGLGAFLFEGSMIDMPTVLQARNIVQLQESVNPGSSS